MSNPTRRTAVVVRNPAARRAVSREAIAAAAARTLDSARWDVEVVEAVSAADAVPLAAAHAAGGVEAVLACGGDGTLLGVINGIVQARRTDCAVGVLPAGTANVWAREAGIPSDLDGALALLEGGTRRPVDLGIARLGEDGIPLRFLLSCGVGLDGAVVQAVERRDALKRRLGRAAYALPAAVAGALWPPVAARLEADGVTTTHERLLLALAANTRRYGGVAPVAPGARVDDGLLDLVTFEGDRGLEALPQRVAMAVAALTGNLERLELDGVTVRRSAHIVIEPERRLPVQADGDAIGWCGPGQPLLLDAEPAAITMIVAVRPTPIFGGGGAG
ncbi:MAG: diacylglycerol kinase family protein [Dehalococcoidia bacterium]